MRRDPPRGVLDLERHLILTVQGSDAGPDPLNMTLKAASKTDKEKNPLLKKISHNQLLLWTSKSSIVTGPKDECRVCRVGWLTLSIEPWNCRSRS